MESGIGRARCIAEGKWSIPDSGVEAIISVQKRIGDANANSGSQLLCRMQSESDLRFVGRGVRFFCQLTILTVHKKLGELHFLVETEEAGRMSLVVQDAL
jgi:hypothetical protein